MEEIEPSTLAENLGNFYVETRNGSGDYHSRSTMKVVGSNLDRYMSSSRFRNPFSIIRNCHSVQKGERSVGCTRLSNKPKLQPLWADFCQRQKKTFLLRCHFHGIILMQSSPETSPQKIVQQRSESPVLNESFDQNFHMAAANLSPDFRNCQFHGCNFHFSSPNWDVAVNSGYDRFDDHLIQSNNISSWKKRILVLRLSLWVVLKLPVLPVVKVIFQRAARDTFTWWLSRLGVRTNQMSCLV